MRIESQKTGMLHNVSKPCIMTEQSKKSIYISVLFFRDTLILTILIMQIYENYLNTPKSILSFFNNLHYLTLLPMLVFMGILAKYRLLPTSFLQIILQNYIKNHNYQNQNEIIRHSVLHKKHNKEWPV